MNSEKPARKIVTWYRSIILHIPSEYKNNHEIKTLINKYNLSIEQLNGSNSIKVLGEN